jgi:outer membrane protein assembly factor BamB
MSSIIKIVLFFCMVSTVFADENFSQWRGPERDGKYPQTKLLQQWPTQGPNLVWSATGFGEGYSSVAVTSDGIYLTGMIDGNGHLFALNKNGKERWRKLYGPEWQDGHDGARSTPTVIGEKIYIMSGQGKAVCFTSNDGKIVWEVDLTETFGARNLRWGMTESPLVDGDRIFYTPGGSDAMMVILDRFTGKTLKVIKGNGEKSAYCSPVIVTHNDKRLLLTMTAESIIGLDVETGEYLWRQEHENGRGINPNTPLYYRGYIYAVSGYKRGGQLIKLSADGKEVEQIWSDETLDSQMGATILVDGYIYGSGHRNKGWYCIDWKTGEVQYTTKELDGKGNIIYAEDLLYCYGEKGNFGLVRPNSKKFELISSFEISEGSGPHWAHPVISEGKLYVRHGDVLLVYDIKKN